MHVLTPSVLPRADSTKAHLLDMKDIPRVGKCKACIISLSKVKTNDLVAPIKPRGKLWSVKKLGCTKKNLPTFNGQLGIFSHWVGDSVQCRECGFRGILLAQVK